MLNQNVKTIKDLVHVAATLYGDRTFVKEIINKEVVSKSYTRLEKDCEALAVWINEMFGKKKVHCVLIGITSYNYLASWLGIQCSCNVSVPLDASASATSLADEINRSDSEVVFFDKTCMKDNKISKIKNLCNKVKYYVNICRDINDEANDIQAFYLEKILKKYDGKNLPNDIKLDEKDLSAILYTSGTTGKSKGVMLSHKNLISNINFEEKTQNLNKMTVLPIHHIYCFTVDILLGIWHGCSIGINDSMIHIPKNAKIFNPQNIMLVPMIADTILKKMDILYKKIPDVETIKKEFWGNNLKTIFLGGAYVERSLIDGYKKYNINIVQGYGMTECSPRISTNREGDDCEALLTLGKPLDICDIKIIENEICVKGPSVMMGYYKDEQETKKAFTKDGYLKTGDLGYIDDKGRINMTGRKKNLIILSNGENVSPEELENKFWGFVPIKEMIVHAKENVITAEVYPDPDYLSKDIVKEIQDKIDKVNDTFPPSKRIVKLIIRDTEFNKTTSRKIKRF